MDIATIQAGFEGLKAAKDIIKTLMELKEFATYQGKLGELNAALVSAYAAALEFQSQAATLLTEKSNLEKEIMNLKAWEAEAQRYHLQEVAVGVFAYVIKETMRNDEPSHWLCSRCYQEPIKSILQYTGGGIHKCPQCKSEISVANPEPEVLSPTEGKDWKNY